MLRPAPVFNDGCVETSSITHDVYVSVFKEIEDFYSSHGELKYCDNVYLCDKDSIKIRKNLIRIHNLILPIYKINIISFEETDLNFFKFLKMDETNRTKYLSSKRLSSITITHSGDQSIKMYLKLNTSVNSIMYQIEKCFEQMEVIFTDKEDE